MPNPTKDDQREIATKCRKGMAYKKKNTAQNNGKTSHKGFQKGNRYGFQSGQSGNPGGRPKKDIASEIAQRVFEENADAIYKAMLKALLKGDPGVFAVLADRAFGKLTLKVEIPGLENLPDLIAEARKGRGGNPPVEHRFKPGQNGNPAGRPERNIAAEIARAIFEKNPDFHMCT